MQNNTERVSLFKRMLLALTLMVLAFTCVAVFSDAGARAETENNIGRTYYRDELKNSELAQRFYGVFAEMAEEGMLKYGKSVYDLTDTLSQDELSQYLSGGAAVKKIPVAFGAARDAFYMDHPDLFYADVYKLYLTAGMKGGKYVAYIDSGNADNYFVDNTVKTQAEAEQYIQNYETALNALVDAAKANSSDPVKQIAFVNEKLSSEVEYDYGAYKDAMNNVTYDGSVNTAYGAIVVKKAMCGGYSRGFKAVMDRLDIPCVLVQGSGYTGKSVVDQVSGEKLQAGYEAHMWNAVKLDGHWYAVDVTWNSSAANRSKYLLVGSDILDINHFEDGVISSSGFELSYPTLRPFNYGVNADKSGFVFKDTGKIGSEEFGYIPTGEEKQSTLTLGISYEGKNFMMLAEDGLHLAFRYGTDTEWTPWYSRKATVDAMGLDEEQIRTFYLNEYTLEHVGNSVQKIQYAVFDCAPNNITSYDLSAMSDDHILAVSTVYSNNAYKEYIPAPYVKHMTPDEKGHIRSFNQLRVTLEYSEQLVCAEGKTEADIGISVTGTHSDLAEHVKIDDIVWNAEKNTVSFLLTPSKYYAHNCETYNLMPTNLVGKESFKTPEPGCLSFKMKQVICPKVFNDGRLYMQVFGQPQFVGAEDLSVNDFKDKNGQPVVGNQRSQMMLVVNSPSKAETDEMMEATDLEQSEVAASATYQIDLQVCGVVQQVPSGSYMQVGFGFPEGFKADSDVTYTVYHYTRDKDGKITGCTAIPCIVSEYGIIATVNSFSPFMICAVKNNGTTNARRNVYASVDGVGGAIDRTTIISVDSGESVTYTIMEDDGYELNDVLLNGRSVKNFVSGNKLTVPYSELGKDGAFGNSDVIDISFISERAAAYYRDNQIEVVRPKLVLTSDDMLTAVAHETTSGSGNSQSSSNTWIVVTVIVIAVVLLAGAAAAALLVVRKKKAPAADAKSSGGKNRK